MPQRIATEDDWDDEPDENSDWEPDEEANGEDTTIPCPHCKESIYDDTERCPRCGKYLSAEETPPSRKPWWVILGAILCLYAVVRWII